MNNIVLKPITKDDLEWARDLKNQNRSAFFYQEEISPEGQAAWFERYRAQPREEYTLFIIWEGDKRVGTTSLKKIVQGVYELGNNIIDIPFRGKGYFTKVYKAALEITGDSEMIAEVIESNKHMLAVYGKLGFRELKREAGIVVVTNKC